MMDEQVIRNLVYAASPRAVNEALSQATSMEGLWSPSEYGQCLDDHLSAPLLQPMDDQTAEIDLASHRPIKSSSEVTGRLSIGEVLSMAQPSIGVLESIKRFAKSCIREPTSMMPSDVAMVLYYTAIAAAWSRCGEYISDLDRSELRRGFEWACSRPWISPLARDILNEGMGNFPYRDA